MRIQDSTAALACSQRPAVGEPGAVAPTLPADQVSLGSNEVAAPGLTREQLRGALAAAQAGNPSASPTTSAPVRLDAWSTPIARKVVDIIDLPEEPAPRLKRPVVFVHGFMGDAADFTGMVDWLGREGTNSFGGVIRGGEPWQADPKADFYVLNFSKPWNPVERNVGELKAAIDEICRKTGASGVDIVAHSKGGIDARSYLMDPDEKVDHLLLLGSPSNGAEIASLGAFVREHLHLEVFPKSDDPEATQCLREISPDRINILGRPTNPLLHELNAHWDVQRSRAQAMEINGAGLPTLGGVLGGTVLGDGLVAERSARLPGIEEKRLWFRQHAVLPFSKSVMREMAAFFADEASPSGKGGDLFDLDKAPSAHQVRLEAQPPQA